MAWMEAERQALVTTFRETDPGAPTLCAGRNARRLLAHLVQREHSPRERATDALRRPEPGHEMNLNLLTHAAESPEGYEALIRRFAAGPPRRSPMSWLGGSAQLVEYIVHHEDVRRAGSAPALTGPPLELALHAIGRRRVAEVQISGSPASVVRFRQWAEVL
ncbi:MAG: maleylpyruvate isomerase family mycothiol-dependent enzyme [Actinomycetota bacterium]|nr:maleylpyruvate isomerase family mycothiol-dependent enzyme [Actinomycetota bacterium]